MKQESAKTLLKASIFLLVAGFIIISPEGGLFLFILAAIFILFGAAMGTKTLRYIAAVLFCITIILFISRFPAAQKSYGAYPERAKEQTK
ncbi:MAG: hypothetical protein GQ569_05840 [Methylococcaceae bacterium]|nr:hypothetical protein [Methylococcaceae bacterium]